MLSRNFPMLSRNCPMLSRNCPMLSRNWAWHPLNLQINTVLLEEKKQRDLDVHDRIEQLKHLRARPIMSPIQLRPNTDTDKVMLYRFGHRKWDVIFLDTWQRFEKLIGRCWTWLVNHCHVSSPFIMMFICTLESSCNWSREVFSVYQ